MDFKRKIKSLISRQESAKSPTSEICQDIVEMAAADKHKEIVDDCVNDPQLDRETIESIETVYYNGGHFDSGLHELEKLSEPMDLTKIIDNRDMLRKQLQAVSKRVYELVLQNQSAYTTELQRVMELKHNLHQASEICVYGRQHLDLSKKVFTTASLKLLSNYRKRKQLHCLLDQLKTIKTLQRTEMRLREMLEEEDFSGAIQLCLECQKVASTYRHYHCISELSSKLQDTLVMIEEQLDVALSKTCSGFDAIHYEKVQKAYQILGKTQTAMDQLHMHYASFIHNTAFTIILGYVQLASPHQSEFNNQKRQYTDLCKYVTADMFIPCLTDLCKALWEGMKSYHLTIAWHERQTAKTDPSDVEATFNRRYVRQKLEHGLGRVWQDVQQKVKAYVLATDLSSFKFDDFLRILDLVNRLIMIGEEFCGSKSEQLQDSLKQQSLNYFRNYHRARLDELRMFLENEGWEMCPVKVNFNVTQLLEFRFMQQHNDSYASVPAVLKHDPNHSHNAAASHDASVMGDQSGEAPPSGPRGYFVRFLNSGNPFDVQVLTDELEDVMMENGLDSSGQREASDSDSDIADELKLDYVDEQTGEMPFKRSFQRLASRNKQSLKSVPIVSSTVLNILRVFGKYMQMMSYLKPIAFDVIQCMSQLFDFYLYTVHSFFSCDLPDYCDLNVHNRLRVTLQRIRESLIAHDDRLLNLANPDIVQADKIPAAHRSPAIDLTTPTRLYGLSERIVAVESLVFLASQFDTIRPHLEDVMPQNRRVFLQQFYSQTLSTAVEVRRPVYGSVSTRTVDHNDLIVEMGTVRWDVKDIMSQHNSYVDRILKECEIFTERLGEVRRRVPVYKAVYNTLWEQTFHVANRTFVEGYASAKKCSNEGRALMQLDFQQYATKLEKLSGIRPMPGREYVDAYIKAYYLPEVQLEHWLREHKEYSNRVLVSLVGCIDHINKKTRQRIVATIDDGDKVRR